MEQQILAGNDRKKSKCNGKSKNNRKCKNNGNSKSNSKSKNIRGSFGSAALRSG